MGWFDDFISNPIQTISNSDISSNTWNVALQASTFGLAGIDPNGGNSNEGVALHAGDEALGYVDGRNAGRDTQAAAQTALNAADLAASNQLKANQDRAQQQDAQASQAAQGIRATSAAQSSAALAYYTSNPSSDEQNFLGV